MGITESSDQNKEDELLPEGLCFGTFENNENICYAIAVFQALFYIQDFKNNVLKHTSYFKKDTVLYHVHLLFKEMNEVKKRRDVLKLNKLMKFVYKKTEMFPENEHQDTHEFLNWILNEINDYLKEEKKRQSKSPTKAPQDKTWCENDFGGCLITHVTCLTCQNITKMKEPFFELHVDLEKYSSLYHCVNQIAKTEELKGSDQFDCEKCKKKCDAIKQTFIEKLPNNLIIHLKRFIYQGTSLKKLHHQVPFSEQMKNFSTSR